MFIIVAVFVLIMRVLLIMAVGMLVVVRMRLLIVRVFLLVVSVAVLIVVTVDVLVVVDMAVREDGTGVEPAWRQAGGGTEAERQRDPLTCGRPRRAGCAGCKC